MTCHVLRTILNLKMAGQSSQVKNVILQEIRLTKCVLQHTDLIY